MRTQPPGTNTTPRTLTLHVAGCHVWRWAGCANRSVVGATDDRSGEAEDQQSKVHAAIVRTACAMANTA